MINLHQKSEFQSTLKKIIFFMIGNHIFHVDILEQLNNKFINLRKILFLLLSYLF